MLNSLFYLGVSAALLLPQGGAEMRRLGGGAVRGGYYFDDDCTYALEAEVGWLENCAALSAQGLVHFRAWREYDLLFGCSQFDPFATCGVKGWINGEVGPSAGLGAFWYLDDHWALRGEANAVLGLERGTEMDYTLSLGVQYSF